MIICGDYSNIQLFAISTSSIIHLVCPPNTLHYLCFFLFLQGITVVPREIKGNAYETLWGSNMVY